MVNQPIIMGVLNITPDSFSDGGLFLDSVSAVTQAQLMVEEGAGIIDIGGESTRPGAPAVSSEDELKRVMPVIEALSGSIDVPISIDTSKPIVMKEAFSAGASIINDVNALRADGALEMAAELGADVCLMHMQGTPRTMQANPSYDNVEQKSNSNGDSYITYLLQKAKVRLTEREKDTLLDEALNRITLLENSLA